MLDLLPRGHALPADVWDVRHRWVTAILAASAGAIPLFALVRGFSLGHALLEAVVPVLLVALACVPRLQRSVRSSVSAVGLMVIASLAVHLSDGAIEAHFLFFVMVPVVALYESYAPFGLAVGYVVFQHGVIGTLHSGAVYSHAAAQDRPWVWAGIHAALFAAACLGSMVSWRLHEQARATSDELIDARAALTRQANTDPLTGVRNRLGLRAELERLRNVSERADRSFAVALCDVDFFKAYNDTYGHQIGDQALRTVASTLTEQVRTSDRVYRYGGEEFLVLLPDQDEAAAAAVMDRVRARLQWLAIEHRGVGADAVLTLSVGVACSRPGRRLTAAQLVYEADQALYTAKTSGRNRTAKLA